MTGRSIPWATGLLLLSCAGLGAVVAYELTGGLPIAPEVTAAAAPTSGIEWNHEPIVFEAPRRREFAEITARPLFSADRRPFEPPVEAGPEADAPVAAVPLELVGVVMTDQQRAALIQPVGSNDSSWVREGEQAEGWHIEKIEQDRVHLRSGESVEVVELRPDTAVPPEARPKRRSDGKKKRQRKREDDGEDGGASQDQTEEPSPDRAAVPREPEPQPDETDQASSD